MINYLKSLGYTFGIVIISTLIITIFNYFNILNGLTFKIVKIIIPLISIFIGSFLLGKNSNKKGYIEGIKYGLICTIIFLLVNIFTKNLHLTTILFFILILLISIFGSIIGINRKKA